MSTSKQEQRAAASPDAQRAGEQMAHARQAAREITHELTESARVVGGVAGAAHEEGQRQPQPQPQHVEVHRGGILETVQQGARSLVSAVSRTLGVAGRESPLAESKDHAARAAKGTDYGVGGREGQGGKDTPRSDAGGEQAIGGQYGVACTER